MNSSVFTYLVLSRGGGFVFWISFHSPSAPKDLFPFSVEQNANEHAVIPDEHPRKNYLPIPTIRGHLSVPSPSLNLYSQKGGSAVCCCARHDNTVATTRLGLLCARTRIVRLSTSHHQHQRNRTNLSKSRWAGGGEDLLGVDLGDAVGQREGQVLGEELLDVGALDIVALLKLDDAENL